MRLGIEHTQVFGIWRYVCMSAEGVGCCHCKTIPHYLWKVTGARGRFLRTGIKKCHSYLQKEQEGRLKEIQTGLPHLYSQKVEGTVLETICKHIRKRKWFRVASIDLWRGNDAWLTWQPSMMKWLAWWMGEEKLMLLIFTLPKLLTLLPITSSLANWWSTA